MDQAYVGSERSNDDTIEAIRATLTTAITTGALQPGMKLQDEVIARHFGVSRTVARGAVAILERERLVDRRRNRGAFIATPDSEEAQQLLATRRVLEMAVVQSAVHHAKNEDLDRLEQIIKEEEAISHGSKQGQGRLIWGNFHMELAQVAGNAVLTEFVKNVVARMSLVAALYEKLQASRCGCDHHRNVIEALRRRDGPAALAAMTHHLDEMEEQFNLAEPVDDQSSLSAVLEKFAPTSP